MATKRRSFRLAEQIREMIAWQLQKAADPRFHLVTITNVVLTPDLRGAKVYWVATGGNQSIEEIDEAFENAEGLFKKALAREIKLRFTPTLKFFYDDTFDVTDNVNRLLERIRPDSQDDSKDESSASDGEKAGNE